jgi:predicted SnoaL-like aldol condensation-catalyzing enzyme
MSSGYKQRVVDLLKVLETGDSKPFPISIQTSTFSTILTWPRALPVLLPWLKACRPGQRSARYVFQDGDFVFAHTEYDFFGPKIGFDIFRFEEGLIVEHWDNLQETASRPSPSGHSMIDGPTTATELEQTEANKALMQCYMDDLLGSRRETFPTYFNGTQYIQHNPWVADTIPGLLAGLQALAAKGQAVVYKNVHKILGEGNFVLVVAEATFGGVSTGIYDLYRIEDGKIAEHWDTLQTIPPRTGWKNDNGKF